MRTILNIYSLAAILLLALFCNTNTLHSQDENKIAGYLNKFKRGEYKEKLDSIVRFDMFTGNKQRKTELTTSINDSNLTYINTIYEWNSSVQDCVPNYKDIRILDSLDRLVQIETYRFYNNKWIIVTKNKYDYHKYTNLITGEYIYNMNFDTDSMELFYKYVSKYNHNDDLISRIGYSMSYPERILKENSSIKWYYNKYNAKKLDSLIHINNGNIVESQYYRYSIDWKSDTLYWLRSFDNMGPRNFKYETFYDNYNRVTLSIGYLYFTNQWNNFSKFEYTHFGMDTTEFIEYKGDFINNNWVQYSKTKLINNSFGSNIITEKYLFDSTLMQWNASKKTINIYDLNKLLIETTNYTNGSTLWRETDQNQYIYDSYGNLLKYEYLIYDNITKQFIIKDMNEYEFDLQTDTNTVLMNFSQDFHYLDNNNSSIFNKLLTKNSFSDMTGNLVNTTKSIFYYSPVIYTSVENKETEILSLIYPNPANTEIRIESKDLINSIEIYDMLGNLKLSQINLNQNENKLDIQSLMSGVYVVKIIGSNFTKNELLTIQR